MANASPESYQAMINALNTFNNQVSEQCSIMSAAGKDCVDNTSGDPAAEKANSALGRSIAKIQGVLEITEKISRALQDELDDIQATGNKSSQFDSI